jgi:murein DD-endopeptidase MepM/ murein hydrolase activator NlpD
MRRGLRCAVAVVGVAAWWLGSATPGAGQEAQVDWAAAVDESTDAMSLRAPHAPIHKAIQAPMASFGVTTAVSCNAVFQRYPVAGRHNHGYDANWSAWGCSTANSNSDWHYGNDIFGARGTPIVAAQEGVISYSFSDATGGKVVYVVDNCGWWHYYAHLDSVDPALWIGKRVTAGTRLGTLGNTGSASGTQPHLHYSVYPGNYYAGIDPFVPLYNVENSSCRSGNACSCLDGINVDGYTIPVTDTDCGHRVCGTTAETWQCGTNQAWTRVGVAGSCNASCSCPGGLFKNGREIPEHMTHCGFRVCGMNKKLWDCTSGGWQNTQISCQ